MPRFGGVPVIEEPEQNQPVQPRFGGAQAIQPPAQQPLQEGNALAPPPSPGPIPRFAPKVSALNPENVEQNADLISRGKDTGVDLAKGMVGLGQSIAGAAQMIDVSKTLGYLMDKSGEITGAKPGSTNYRKGLVKTILDDVGYDPSKTNEWLSGFYSDERASEEAKLDAAKGVVESLKVLATEPGLAVGKAVESAPGMVGIMGGARVVAGKVAVAAEKALIKKGITDPRIIAEVVTKASEKWATIAASFAEGGQQAGSSFDELARSGVGETRNYISSLGSGAVTALTSLVMGKFGQKVGLGDVEAGIAGKGSLPARIIKGGVQEGLLEEGIQSPQELAWSNWAQKRNITDGLGKAWAIGTTTGFLSGSVFSMGAQKSEDAPAPAEPVSKEKAFDSILLANTEQEVVDIISSLPESDRQWVQQQFNTTDKEAEGDQLSVKPESVKEAIERNTGAAETTGELSETEKSEIGKVFEPAIREETQAGLEEAFAPGTIEARAQEKENQTDLALQESEAADFEEMVSKQLLQKQVTDKEISDKKIVEATIKKEAESEAQYQADLEQSEKALPSIPAEEQSKMKREAESEVNANPVYEHMSKARSEALDLKQIKQDYTKNSLKDIPGHQAMFTLNGRVSPDDFASRQGYESLDQMIEAFKSAPSKSKAIARAMQGKVLEWQRAEEAQRAEETRIETEAAPVEPRFTGTPVLAETSAAVQEQRPSSPVEPAAAEDKPTELVDSYFDDLDQIEKEAVSALYQRIKGRPGVDVAVLLQSEIARKKESIDHRRTVLKTREVMPEVADVIEATLQSIERTPEIFSIYRGKEQNKRRESRLKKGEEKLPHEDKITSFLENHEDAKRLEIGYDGMFGEDQAMLTFQAGLMAGQTLTTDISEDGVIDKKKFDIAYKQKLELFRDEVLFYNNMLLVIPKMEKKLLLLYGQEELVNAVDKELEAKYGSKYDAGSKVKTDKEVQPPIKLERRTDYGSDRGITAEPARDEGDIKSIEEIEGLVAKPEPTTKTSPEQIPPKEEPKFSKRKPSPTVKEQGQTFKTGTPVTFQYVHNKESATGIFGKPKKGERFGRYFEPSGKYVTATTYTKNAEENPDQFESGTITFQNPLVVDNDSLNWKETLSKEYGGKRGKNLSKALIAAGYDGVVTVDNGHTSEIIDFTSFDEAKALYSKGISKDKNLYTAHNLSAENLRHAIDLGGLAAPSLAVGNVDKTAFTSFGEITLLADPGMLFSPKTKTFDADVYSPRHPSTIHVIDQGRYNDLIDEIGETYGLSKPSFSDLEDSNGIDRLARNPGFKYAWLRDRGINIPLKKLKVPVAAAKIAKMQGSRYDLEQNKKVKNIATKAANADIAKMPEDIQDEFKKRWLYENGDASQRYIDDLVSSAVFHRDKGGYDQFELNKRIATKLRTKKISAEFDSHVRATFEELVKDRKIFKGYTNQGTRRYAAYNLDNVVKDMTKTLRGGEGFNYGAGSIRSAFAKQFRSIAEIQKNRDRIVTSEEMRKISTESQDKLVELLDELRPSYKFDSSSFGYLDDASSAIAEGGRGLREAFDLDEEMHGEIKKYTDYLKNLPTEYFEAKMQRAVSLSEFNAAIVPKGTDKKLVDELKRRGLKVKTYKEGDTESRLKAVRDTATLFAKGKPSPESKSTVSDLTAVVDKLVTAKGRKNLGLNIVQSVDELMGKLGVDAKYSVVGYNFPDSVLSEIKSIDNDIEVFVSQKGDIVTLSEIQVPKNKRNTGIGTKVLEILSNYADANGLTIALHAAGDYGGSRAGQVRLYKRMGFVANKGRNKDYKISDNMLRRPQAELKYSKDGEIEGAYSKGKTYLVSDNVSTDQAWATVLHESVHKVRAEKGWSEIFGKKSDAINKSIDAKIKLNNPGWKAAEQKAIDAGTPSESMREETIAYFLADSANKKQSLYRRIVNAIKSWAVNFGLTRTITDDMIVSLAEASIRRVARRRAPLAAGVMEFAQPIAAKLSKATSNILANPKFLKWFGDSKVVDADGNPLVVYHGGIVPESFERRSGEAYAGVYFGDKEDASSYADTGPSGGQSVAPVYLRIKNIADLESDKKAGLLAINTYYDSIGETPRNRAKSFEDFIGYGIEPYVLFENEIGLEGDDVRAALEAAGYDGASILEEDKTQYIAFSPTQIKSIFNKGTFSETDPRIMYSKEQISQSEKQGNEIIDQIIAKMKTAGQFDKAKVASTVKRYEDKISSLREIASDTATDTNTKQKQVKDVLSALPIHVRGRAINEIVKIGQFKTGQGRQKAVDRAMGRIVALLDQYHVSEGNKKIDKMLIKAKDKIKKGVSKGSTDVETFEQLKRIKSIRGMTFEQIENKLDKLIPDDQISEPTEEDIAEIALYNTFGNLRSKTSEEVAEAIEHLQYLIVEGKMKWNAMIDADRARRKEIGDMAEEVISSGKDPLEPHEKGLSKNILTESLQAFSDKSQSWQFLMEKLSRFDKESRTLKSKMKYFVNLVHGAAHKESSGVLEQNKNIQGKLKEIYGKGAIKTSWAVAKNAVDVKNTGINLYGLGGGVIHKNIKTSQNKAYKKWMEWQDLSLREDLKRQGVTEKTITEIENFMTPEVRKWAEWQIEEFYPEYHGPINEVFRALTYTNMPKSDNYSPTRRDYKKGNDQDLTLDGASSYHASMMKASTKRRVKNKLALSWEKGDGDSILAQHIAEMEHFKAWSLVIRELRSVFSRQDIGSAISDHHGDSIRGVINDFIERFVRGGSDSRNNIAALDRLRSMFTVLALAGNNVVFLKQLTSIPAYAMSIPTKDFVTGVAKALANPVKAYKTVMSSEAMKTRYTMSQMERDLSLIAKKTPAKQFTGGSTLSDKAMVMTKLGDKLAIVFGGYPAYLYNYKKQLAKHGDKELAQKEALEEFDIITESAQQASGQKDLSVYQTGGSLQKGLTMFMTTPASYARYEEAAVRNILSRKGDLKENIKILAITHILLPTIFQLVASGGEWDEEKMKRAWTLGPLNGLFIWRDLLGGVADQLFLGKAWGFSAQPHLDALYEFLTGIADKGFNFEDMTKMVAATRSFKGVMDAVSGKTEHPIRRSIGYSESALDVTGTSYKKYNKDFNRGLKKWEEDKTNPRPRLILKTIKKRIASARKDIKLIEKKLEEEHSLLRTKSLRNKLSKAKAKEEGLKEKFVSIVKKDGVVKWPAN